MSHPQPPASAKLIIGLIVREKGLVPEVAGELMHAFGRADMISPWFPFGFTTYYQAEMGAPLFRRMFSFEALIEQPALVDVKLLTNDMERKWSHDGNRRINLDPGYLLAERFVLATGKNYSHRIYLGQGIYADLTLVYQKGGFCSLPWTYPGYRQPDMQRFLLQARSKYRHDLKAGTDIKPHWNRSRN
ncbi:MAG: DUF4416 domain-containing protein [Deltaproteobacteria bacterium]|nr:MAG: DUF4416 domain-containing protein [Deltaproteobacteria bacterium]